MRINKKPRFARVKKVKQNKLNENTEIDSRKKYWIQNYY